MEDIEDPAMEIASDALRRMLSVRSELDIQLGQAQRLDLAISHQRRVLARLRGTKIRKPGPNSNAGKALELLNQNPRGLPLETIARALEIDSDTIGRALGNLVSFGWAERVREGFFRATP